MNKIFSGLIIFCAAVFFYFNMGVKVRPDLSGGGINEVFWPTLLLVLLMILSLIMFVSGLVQAKRSNEKFSQLKIGAILNAGAARFIMACIVCFAYTTSLRYLGFLVATPIMLILLLFLLGFRGFLRLVPAPIILTFVLTFVFANLARLALPTGMGIFKTINLLVR